MPPLRRRFCACRFRHADADEMPRLFLRAYAITFSRFDADFRRAPLMPSPRAAAASDA